MKTSSRPVLFVALLATACCLVAPAVAAEKKTKTKKHEGTYSNNNGKSGAFEGTTTREKGKTERSGAWTNQDGKSGARESVRTRDKDTGSGSFSGVTTGPEGKTATMNGTTKK